MRPPSPLGNPHPVLGPVFVAGPAARAATVWPWDQPGGEQICPWGISRACV